jgi:hypothetical protein
MRPILIWSRERVGQKPYDWLPKFWVIARAISFAKKGFWLCAKHYTDRLWLTLYSVAISRTLTHHHSSRIVCAIVVRLIVQIEDLWCHLLYNLMISSATTCDWIRLVAQPYFRWCLSWPSFGRTIGCWVPKGSTITHYWSYDRTHLCDCAATRTISRTIVCNHLQPRRFLKQSHYAIALEDRADWSYFDNLSLVVRFQNRAIRCDWSFRQYRKCEVPILFFQPPFVVHNFQILFGLSITEKTKISRNAHLVHQNWYRISFSF